MIAERPLGRVARHLVEEGVAVHDRHLEVEEHQHGLLSGTKALEGLAPVAGGDTPGSPRW